MTLEFETTKDIEIPSDPLSRIIGQDEAVKAARIIAKQRRHLLLVGPPGIGKSLIAQAIGYLLPKPKQEISVLHNPKNPERPVVDVRSFSDVTNETRTIANLGKILTPAEVPSFVSERLGFRCRRCGTVSRHSVCVCPQCGADKYRRENTPFDDLIFGFAGETREDRVVTTMRYKDGREEIVVYERTKDDKIRKFSQQELHKMEEVESKRPRKVLLTLERNTFVQATGASETELLGDIRHDPYGGHPEVGTLPYLCVVPGSVHEAHEGVLFIDEIPTLGELQRYLLTAMQEKKFPITGRNSTSSGASVKVESVPCDFILVGALNTNDLQYILAPLRSRIIGNGYEILLNTHMDDTMGNREKIAQFVAQEVVKDGRIPHLTRKAVELIIEEAKSRAKRIDDANGLTLRLRGLAGVIKLAGDEASVDGIELIDENYVKKALLKSKTIEEQVSERYDSWWKAGQADAGQANTPYTGKEIR
ncbi:Archaeal Lon protease [Candidatus Gugararchaeum adminiculabundum]|nr:Archaeal Lon protease [Candidatus Gugararchaeum adminiculabundum]